MAGTKTAATNKAKYGKDFYAKIGAKGGRAHVAKGFAKMDPERRREIAIKTSKKAAEARQKNENLK